VQWYQNGTYEFTSDTSSTGPNGGTLSRSGHTATLHAGPLTDTGVLRSWTALVDYYAANGADLFQATSTTDTTTCGF